MDRSSDQKKRKEIGKRLGKARRDAKYTQAQLAAALGVEQSGISKIERGLRGVDLINLLQIADALGCSRDQVTDIIFGNKEKSGKKEKSKKRKQRKNRKERKSNSKSKPVEGWDF